jgi:adenylate kinase
MNIIILGPLGSGKGTQARLIAEKLNLFYFESGKFLRQLAKNDSSIDERINKKGELLPDKEMFSLLAKHIEDNNPTRENLLLEGYPRSVKQYELLKEWLAEKSQQIDKTIFLEISEKESIRRTSARKIDRKTGEIYNLITNPPGPDVDTNNLYQRPDDKPEAIKKRLDWFKDSVLPLVDVFEKEGILERVDGERPIKIIFEDILSRLEGNEDEKN